MSTRIDDMLALVGLACVLAGVYLLVGLAPALILLGLVLIYVGARIQIAPKRGQNEPD